MRWHWDCGHWDKERNKTELTDVNYSIYKRVVKRNCKCFWYVFRQRKLEATSLHIFINNKIFINCVTGHRTIWINEFHVCEFSKRIKILTTRIGKILQSLLCQTNKILKFIWRKNSHQFWSVTKCWVLFQTNKIEIIHFRFWAGIFNIWASLIYVLMFYVCFQNEFHF